MEPIILYILAALSAITFFGFVAFCWAKFGLQTCYSAYGPLFRDNYPFNWWSFFTSLSAAMLMPVMLSVTQGHVWQFTGFLCCAFIVFIGCTPDYDKNKTILTIHLILAEGAALWAILFILLNAIRLWWLIPAYLAACGICILIFGKKTWNYWLEMAAFLFTYTATFLMINI